MKAGQGRLWQSPVVLVLFFAFALGMGFSFSSKKEILDSAEYTQNGISYRAAIEGRSETKHWEGSGFLAGKSLSKPFILGKEIVIYEKPESGGSWQEKGRYNFEGVGPWCIAMGQMDQQEDIEVFIGAYRATRYFPEGTRPYLFTWNFKEQQLNRLWSGSYFDAPIFLTAEFEDVDADGFQEIKLEERKWLGEEEFHYITYYTYQRKSFQPIKVKREVIEHKRAK